MPRKEPGFAERLQTAAKAKKAQLERIRTFGPGTREQSTQQQAAQLEAAAARKIRTAERKNTDQVGAERRRRNARPRTPSKHSLPPRKGLPYAVAKRKPMQLLKRIRRLRATRNMPRVKLGRNRASRATERTPA